MESNPQLQGGGAQESSTSDGYPEDVEAEANSYFHQMFSGQLTIDAMVQMLARFRETSEDSREQSIFDCMIANLFEEYKFFPKYSEKQLIIAAVLFGSLIKHQLVTHLTLGIALRGVLDALRTSSDSKMFLFGTKALEQFMDRLVEWPHYSNHILQISHLRLARADLVVFIEHALARNSSGPSEPNGAASEKVEGGGAQKSFTSHGYPEDVVAEANSYFHQIFSGQLTIDATVQILARFKQYPVDSREQSIFDCMIRNLFAEYRYFPNYPEKQLKIAAVLFGSLIKHRLVTHLALGTALRGVLDALRTSSDSKMLVFGTKALEQFKDRLVEWPQYSNHILQISHLRLTHVDLVVFIQRALARISSGHSEPNGAATAVNHHQVRQPPKMWR